MSKMKEFRQGVFGNADVRQYGMVFSLIAIITLFYFTTDGVVLSSVNLINIISQYSYILILAIGMVMVIIAGHIDLSVGSVAAFVGIVVANAMADWGIAWPLGIVRGPGRGHPRGRMAGLLGLPGHGPRLHRDAGRHAHLPRAEPGHRPVATPCRCPRASR